MKPAGGSQPELRADFVLYGGDMATRTAEYWQTIIQALILVVLALTAWILGWYTKETYRLRRESERQTELLLRPFVIAEFVPTPEPAAPVLFKVQNIGNRALSQICVSCPDSAMLPADSEGEEGWHDRLQGKPI
jgi:hypothetical protein